MLVRDGAPSADELKIRSTSVAMPDADSGALFDMFDFASPNMEIPTFVF